MLLGAYWARNAAAAQAVIDREQGLDDRYQGIARQVLSFAMEDPRLISWSLLVSAAAKAAKRVIIEALRHGEVVFPLRGLRDRRRAVACAAAAAS